MRLKSLYKPKEKIRALEQFLLHSIYLSDVLKKCKDKPKQNTLKKLQSSLTTKAKEFKYNLSPMTPDIKARNKNSNSKTFHKAGMVVPVDATEVGYRPLTVTDGEYCCFLLIVLLILNK